MGDREYAISRADIDFDPDLPKYFQKNNFLALVNTAKLANYQIKYDQATRMLSVLRKGKELIKVNLSNNFERLDLVEFLYTKLDIKRAHKLDIIRATEGTNQHSFSDLPDKVISFINLSTVKSFSEKIGLKIDPLRFRANINFSSNIPWWEFECLNKKLKIDKVVLEVIKKTRRCAATSVNPSTAIRDINIPRYLKNNYGHTDLGVYAKVLEGGQIMVGDKIELLW
ncbi:MAG: MOSC domain-containing protein [Rhodospirillaceae bacterium]|nr:MOSC domain-containing protein [Rhodospirillaceae bacterium]OUT77205.1 MAG: hypothetical protein CBB83_08390 [Rhodospirillaceae bacterium TMED23]